MVVIPQGVRLANLLAAIPGTMQVAWSPDGGTAANPWVRGVQLWEAVSPPEPGQLVALATQPPYDLAILRTIAGSRCAAVLVRTPDDAQDRKDMAELAERLGLVMLWLEGKQPWWPVLLEIESALSGAATPAARLATTRPGDLFALADEMASAVGGPVILEDTSFRVLAYSAFVGQMDRGRAEAILGRRIPEPWLEHLARTGSLDRLRSTSDIVDLVGGPWQARRRLITAVRLGSRQLGVVWVSEGNTPLPAGATEALRHAVRGAVPHLLRHLEQVGAEADRRARHVRALLDGGSAALAAAGAVGFGSTSTFAVLAVTCSAPGGTGDEPEEVWGRLIDHVGLCCESFRREAAVARFGRAVLAVVEVTPQAGGDSVGRLAQEIVRLTGGGLLSPVRAAVSSLGSGLASLTRLRDEALAALAVLDTPTGPSCVRFEEVEADVLIRDVVAMMDPGAGLSGLDRLLARDASGGGDLVATLRAYLEAGGSVTPAAVALGVHVTTLRHRLTRITEVSGLRLERPAVRIACDLLLRRNPR